MPRDARNHVFSSATALGAPASPALGLGLGDEEDLLRLPHVVRPPVRHPRRQVVKLRVRVRLCNGPSSLLPASSLGYMRIFPLGVRTGRGGVGERFGGGLGLFGSAAPDDLEGNFERRGLTLGRRRRGRSAVGVPGRRRGAPGPGLALVDVPYEGGRGYRLTGSGGGVGAVACLGGGVGLRFLQSRLCSWGSEGPGRDRAGGGVGVR